MKIAIIDTIGLQYDGNTLKKQGLGGSESAVILISKELVNLGFDVTVFNNCIGPSSNEGVFDNVTYVDNTNTKSYYGDFDIAISSRTIVPFVKDNHPFVLRAKKRILWMHDTFLEGDQYLEKLVVNGMIDHVFTLSDWHSNYVMNNDHGGYKKMFEILKPNFFQTRNGVVNYIKEIDLNKKDKDLFVYNASATKGMTPLVTKIWPRVKEKIPSAKLKIIGGFYRFSDEAGPDEQEKTVREYMSSEQLKNIGIEFTGVIKQSEIAEILAKANFTIYPADFPETFGISSLESILYKTPLITCRFGALEETALDMACYKIDYPVTKNSLFPHIDEEDQINRFIEMVLYAYENTYIHQQKQQYCSIINDLCTWDTIALQWKQFFFHIFNKPLSVDEYRKVKKINNDVTRIFNRTKTMPLMNEYISNSRYELPIKIITPLRNASVYIKKCILSVAQQDYENYEHIIIDDNSTDNSLEVIKNTINELPLNIQQKFKIIENEYSQGALKNQVDVISSLRNDNDIIMLLDGDDWLIPNNTIFNYYNDLYQEGYDFTYGSSYSLADNINLIAQEYPNKIIQKKSFRKYKFNWNMPYTHLRTFKKSLMNEIDLSSFKNENGEWYTAGGDGSLFYSCIEKANKIKAVKEVMYVYNDLNPLNDYKVNGDMQTKTANEILQKNDKFTVVIPTMWRAKNIFIPFLEKLTLNENIDEIIIINNDVMLTPESNILNNEKIILMNMSENIYVNPAWNLGVKISSNDYVCILNDDVEFDLSLFDKVKEHVSNEDIGIIGFNPGDEILGQTPYSHKNITIEEWDRKHTFGFGTIIFVNKKNWIEIPEELKIYYGDNYLFDMNLKRNKKIFTISNIDFYTEFAQTTKDSSITKNFLKEETEIYKKIMFNNEKKDIEYKMKKILIAIPTNKYIECETFKSIYDLDVPNGYEIDFQYFFGYSIAQIRNLIAEWGKNYDYLFSVDSDIVLPKNTLTKMISHDVDVVSGLYRQRKHESNILEIYKDNDRGGVSNILYEELPLELGIIEIAAAGFGCILIKSNVLKEMEYPHFYYKSALDHKDTFSEDIYFCLKARDLGYKIYVDPTIQCNHIGSYQFIVDKIPPLSYPEKVHQMDLLPKIEIDYLHKLANDIQPKVIYDIGASVLHWERHAKDVWPNSKFILFDAEKSVEPILNTSGHDYNINVLSDEDYKNIDFYSNKMNLGGNSYYKENSDSFNDNHIEKRITRTLDSIVNEFGYPLPELIKLDVQGAEIDILKGAKNTLSNVNDIILEAQKTNYNQGAPKLGDVIEFMNSIGFYLYATINENENDGNYHFKKNK